jgi:hypothetical protein
LSVFSQVILCTTEVGLFFWPFTPELVQRMAEAVDRYAYDMIGVADTPGNAMDPWVAATIDNTRSRAATRDRDTSPPCPPLSRTWPNSAA